jgi:general nucleoside transport system ATP-binding protein
MKPMKQIHPVIEMVGITKVFPGIVANDAIHLSLMQGEIHALLGENGAGKSTLMSVLFGLYQAEAGLIKKNGHVVKINNPNDANKLGIGMVHQHFKLVEVFTVLDNILLGFEPMNGLVVNRKKARQEIEQLSSQYGLKVNLDERVENISVGMQQRVEILKMLYRKNSILIFDEPTAVLTPQEIVELMDIMRNLIKENKSILFITHKLQEIMAVSHRVTVLRKGKYIGTVETSKTSIPELSKMMVGRDVMFQLDKKPRKPGEVVFSCDQLTVNKLEQDKAAVKDVSFSVRKGEIVGIAGIEGNGQSELAYAISGLLPIQKGHMTLNHHTLETLSVRQRNDRGLAHIPEDRHRYGLILDFPIYYNLSLKQYHRSPINRYGFLNFKHMEKLGRSLIERFDIRTSQGANTDTRSMSGGNQQKAIIAREINSNADFLLSVQLTRGLDVGAIEYIHQQILQQRDEGKAILLISLELDEILKLSDRILVMFEGQIVKELNPEMTNQEEIGLYMAGGSSHA